MISEAHHYTLFLKLARKYSDEKEKVMISGNLYLNSKQN